VTTRTQQGGRCGTLFAAYDEGVYAVLCLYAPVAAVPGVAMLCAVSGVERALLYSDTAGVCAGLWSAAVCGVLTPALPGTLAGVFAAATLLEGDALLGPSRWALGSTAVFSVSSEASNLARVFST
jgi:hypothetical protein